MKKIQKNSSQKENYEQIKMISRSETPDFTKQETTTTTENNNNNNGNNKPSSSSITSWSRLKDPRIVRVSRAFGGKDRHSKVCTVRGLRDRRVRLSVPTAIQLYDLQDRLGLNQPSKVVDWLLNAAKTEIDDLPPLQFPQGSFSASLLPILASSKQTLKSKEAMTSAEGTGEGSEGRREESWVNLGINQGSSYHDQSQQSSHAPPSSSSSSSLLLNSFGNSFVRWDPSSSLTLSHPPPPPTRSPNCHNQGEDWQNFVPHHHYQVMLHQPYFQPEFDSSKFQSSGEASAMEARPVRFDLLPSQNNNDS